jgi:hypothetical protein
VLETPLARRPAWFRGVSRLFSERAAWRSANEGKRVSAFAPEALVASNHCPVTA